MSVLVVGVSHNTAPVSVLERLSLGADGLDKLLRGVADCEHVLEATVLATCNRIEIYAEVDRFHGSVEAVSRLLCELADEGPRTSSRTSTCTTTTARSRTCSTSPPGSTRWSSARARSSARPARRSGSARRPAPSDRPSTCCSSRRCGSASGCTPRPTSTAPRPPWSAVALERAAAHVGPIEGKRVLVVGAGSMAGLAVATVVPARRRRHRGRQPHRGARPPPRRAVRRPGGPAGRDAGRRSPRPTC